MSMCRVVSYVCWRRVFAMTSTFSWKNSFSLCPVSFYTLRPNFPVTPGISWLPTFAFQSPVMKKTSFFGVSLESFQRTIQLHLLWYPCFGNILGLLWCWMVCLENKRIILLFLRLVPIWERSTSSLFFYCQPVYLTYIQSTSCEMLGWMKHKLESRFPGEISVNSDMQIIPL